MKRAPVCLAASAMLAACGPDPVAVPAPPVGAAPVAVAPDAGMSNTTAGLLGAAAGFLTGRSTSPRYVQAAPPVIVHRPVIVHSPGLVPPALRHPPRFSAPRLAMPSASRLNSFRPSASFGRRRR